MGEDDDVVQVSTGRTIIFPATGDEHQAGWPTATVDPVSREVLDWEALDTAHPEQRGGGVAPGDLNLVTALQTRKAVEDRRSGLRIHVPDDHGIAG